MSQKKKPKLIIFASGTKDGGGSGFENMVNAMHSGMLSADIVAVVSNHEHGGVKEKAVRLGIPFIHFNGPFDEKTCRKVVHDSGARWVALSGWLKLMKGLDPKYTFNIHPGPLPQFGGDGMYGHHVHEAVIRAYKRGEVTHSAVSMHFVTDVYDEGPLFFQKNVPIYAHDTPETLGKRVNIEEHYSQPRITDLVVTGKIAWDGKNPKTLDVPEGYEFLPK